MVSTVAIMFSDSSLGGTSRSALNMGRIWRRIGWDVVFVALAPITLERLEHFARVGPAIAYDLVQWSDIDLIHWHQGGGEENNRRVFRALLQTPEATRIPILSHNVFGYPDRYLRRWPSPRRTSVLGVWAAWQYWLASWPAARFPAIVGNPQDEVFFRPPNDAERSEARRALKADDWKAIVLRIGSPIDDKWSWSYVELADRLSSLRAQLVLVGVPDRLKAELEKRSNVLILNQTGVDADVRRLYWGADVFALDSTRGESFGNVATEAMLSGCPVVYRARRLRDNTPWEFQGTDGFHYARSRACYVETVCSLVVADARDLPDHESIAAKYGFEASACSLINASHGLIGQGRQEIRRYPIGIAATFAILLLHNPVVALAKQARRRLGLYGLLWRG